MADLELSELLKTQISLTEWLQNIGHKDAADLRKEDGTKRPRLGILNEVIGLPFDKPEYFDATELTPDNVRFKQLLDDRGDELCALRLVPKDASLPKLRNRGKSIRDAYQWFLEQHIDTTQYTAEVVPHNDEYHWATIFVVNKQGVFGEIVWGGHHLLTQGFHGDATPSVFTYDFSKWSMYPENPKAIEHLKELLAYIHVPSEAKQQELTERVGAHFINDYLTGYFETTDTGAGTWFIDYSPKLGDIYAEVPLPRVGTPQGLLAGGQTGSGGAATGPVRIVSPKQLTNPDLNFSEGAVLVCTVTTPDFVPLMQKAAAIVTDQGGILSHAAIVARELKVPCIVGAQNATQVLKDGQLVHVDANDGVVLPG